MQQQTSKGLPTLSLDQKNNDMTQAPGEYFSEHHDGKFRPLTVGWAGQLGRVGWLQKNYRDLNQKAPGLVEDPWAPGNHFACLVRPLVDDVGKVHFTFLNSSASVPDLCLPQRFGGGGWCGCPGFRLWNLARASTDKDPKVFASLPWSSRGFLSAFVAASEMLETPTSHSWAWALSPGRGEQRTTETAVYGCMVKNQRAQQFSRRTTCAYSFR